MQCLANRLLPIRSGLDLKGMSGGEQIATGTVLKPDFQLTAQGFLGFACVPSFRIG